MKATLATRIIIIIIITMVIPLLIMLLALNIIWKAWWLYPAWGWFLVPLGLPAISFWHFAALMFLVTVLTHPIDMKKDDRKTEWAAMLITVPLWPVIVWAMLRWMAP